MGRKAKGTTTGWRKRYLVNVIHGNVWLLRGKGKWQWLDIGKATIVDSEAQLVALRLQGVPVRGEPRW